MEHFDAQNRKTEKGGTDTTSGAAGSESKQNKGVREGFLVPEFNFSLFFHFWAQKRKIS